MKTIRHSVFETNSSSSHSISICEENCFVPDKLHVDADGTCRIYTGEFGYEVEEYTDAATKASYCLTHAMSINGKLSNEDKVRKEKMEYMLRKVIKEFTGAKKVAFLPSRPSTGFHDWGYIDHESSHVADEAFVSEDKLAAFIFNKSSILITDNDNY